MRRLRSEKVNRLLLSGQISNQQKMNVAMRIAETYAAGQAADDAKESGRASSRNAAVINLMSIGGAQTVMLKWRSPRFSEA